MESETDLETGGAPVDELDRTLGLDGRDSRVDVLGNDVSTVEESASHVLALAGVALDHLRPESTSVRSYARIKRGKGTNLVRGLEAREGELGGRVGLVGRLGGGDDGRVGREGEVNPGERNQLQSNPAYQSRTLSTKEVEDSRWSGTRSSRR
jgi:hypothetical protein